MTAIGNTNHPQPENNQDDLCGSRLHPLAVQGLELFNQRKFFEAHEALEIAWKAEQGPARDLYRGILQIGVAYLHIERANLPGAFKMFARAKRCLAPFPDTCRGIDLQKFRQDFGRVETFLSEKGLIPSALQEMFFKPISYRTSNE